MEFIIDKRIQVKPFHKHWQFCVGSDHAAVAIRADYVNQLKFIHDELGIQYVRFHGIFNDDMHTLDSFNQVFSALPGGEKIVERNFYLCGVVYDNILSCGMKPFVELSFMPQSLAKEKKTDGGFYGSNFNNPRDLKEWADYVQSFIQYLLHRYGNEEVESWFFEVWNEPDLMGAFYLGTQEEYYKLYEVTAKAIKEINPKLRVGGPATSGSKWIKSFVSYCKQNNLPLDYVSTHQYAGDPLGGVEDEGGPDNENTETKKEDRSDKKKQLQEKLASVTSALQDDNTCLDILRMMFGDPSETKDIASDTFKKNSAIVKRQAEGLPVYYTEWNMLATFSAYSNDTKKAAAYNLKTALDIEENVTGSCVWCFSDIFEELHQFKEEFHGGFGLQTIHGIPKPTFYALKMLTELGSERYDLGENSTNHEIGIAAFMGENRKDILLFRQKMKQIDLPKEKVNIKMELAHKPSKVILERIDDNHCNPLKIWEEDGSKADLTPQEVEEIKAKSQLTEETLDYVFKDGWFEVTVGLCVNDIYHIKIFK